MLTKTDSGVTARFGYGTVSMKTVPKPNRVSLVLNQCTKSAVGEDLPEGTKVKKDVMISLTFYSEASLDALINKLEHVRAELQALGEDHGA